ncbi:MAG: dolichyl-phosphate beta-glucosyltransferase [Patescibacteria group bacterium]
MSEEFYLSIIIPAYKESHRIHKVLGAIEKLENKVDYKIETVVVVDGAPDNTAEKAHEFDDRLKNLVIIDRKENKGKGYTVREGMLKSHGKYRLFADADNSTPVEQVEKLLEYVKDYDVVIGSRYVEGGKLAIPQSFVRKMGGRAINLVIRATAISGIHDTQCGFKLFSERAAERVFSKVTFERWSFDIEVLAIARKFGFKIKEVGITWYDDPHSLVNPIKDGLRMMKDSWQVRKNIRAGVYREK